MKLGLGPLGVVLVATAALAFGSGCAAQSAPAPSTAVSTTTVSGATVTLSRLPAATWADEDVPAPRPASPKQTWGAPVTSPAETTTP